MDNGEIEFTSNYIVRQEIRNLEIIALHLLFDFLKRNLAAALTRLRDFFLSQSWRKSPLRP